jgi:hypothetical protein
MVLSTVLECKACCKTELSFSGNSLASLCSKYLTGSNALDFVKPVIAVPRNLRSSSTAAGRKDLANVASTS